MKNISTTIILLFIAVSASALVYLEFGERSIDSDYTLMFSTRSTDGTFSGIEGVVIFDPTNLNECKIDVSVDASTIKTGNKKKDEHARSADWLDVKKHPKIAFRSNQFSEQGEKFLVDGEMTLHGVTKKVQIPFLYDAGTFSGTFVVNRSDYNVTGVGMKAKFVGEEIEITFKIPTSLKQ